MASETATVTIAGLGIAGTLASALLTQGAESRRTGRALAAEDERRQQDRRDALERERRAAIRTDYRDALRFIARTRLFVEEIKSRFKYLDSAETHQNIVDREVEDLEARAATLRRIFLDELPEVQAIVGTWGADNLIAVFDDVDDCGVKIAASMSLALHLTIDGRRLEEAGSRALEAIDQLLDLLSIARELIRKEQEPI